MSDPRAAIASAIEREDYAAADLLIEDYLAEAESPARAVFRMAQLAILAQRHPEFSFDAMSLQMQQADDEDLDLSSTLQDVLTDFIDLTAEKSQLENQDVGRVEELASRFALRPTSREFVKQQADHFLIGLAEAALRQQAMPKQEDAVPFALASLRARVQGEEPPSVFQRHWLRHLD